jgi:hypothetical protein
VVLVVCDVYVVRCVISGSRGNVDEICAGLGYYVA